MAVVEIRCPRCGTRSKLKKTKDQEYSCDYCGTLFRFVDSEKKHLIYDSVRYNCPLCGRPIRVELGYTCKKCGKEDLCENCVDEVQNRMICIECLEKEGMKCSYCKRYGEHKCPSCGRKACGEHKDELFQETIYDRKKNSYKIRLYCSTCHDYICHFCYKKKRIMFIATKYYCKNCGTKLKLVYD